MKHLIAKTALAIVLIHSLALAASGPDPTGAPPAASAAQPAPANVVKMPGQNVLTIDAGTGRVIQLGAGAASVFAADPKVAEVHPASPTSLFVFGVAPGRTTIAALSAGGAPIAQYDVIVKPSRFGAAEVESAVARQLPGAKVHVETMVNGLAISGQVNSPGDADRVMQIVRGYLPSGQTVDNRLSVGTSIQVNLRVRIAEMSRNLVRQLGVNWEALGNIGTIGKFPVFPALTLNTNSNTTTAVANSNNPLNLGVTYGALITALDNEGLATILAEPTLTAISGETANFLAGGQFPIPVPQGNQVTTIEYKSFGVSVDFTPTVLDGNRISIKVRPEVSELTQTGAITINGTTVPALNLRRAETTVELGSGESFAIAGLFQNNGTNAVNGLPFLKDIPILGALFRSTSFQRNESELVIIVTPIIVRPTERPTDVHLPTDGFQFSSDIERILLGRLTPVLPTGGASPNPPASTPHLHGAAGFILE